MKTFIGIVVIFAAVGYYFDISPTDFLPRLPNSEPAKERHASASSAPAQPSAATSPNAATSEGSLATRWKSDSGASAKKP